ncbi:hypothetical protein B1144_11150, partial [Enterococcus faecium]
MNICYTKSVTGNTVTLKGKRIKGYRLNATCGRRRRLVAFRVSQGLSFFCIFNCPNLSSKSAER